MSNITLQPPAVQWCIQHALVQVALHHDETGTWQLVAATPQSASGWSNPAPLPLVGSWVAPDPTRHTGRRHRAQADALHRPAGPGVYRVVGRRWWDVGTNFTDQGLQFTAGAGVGSATIASPGFGIAADAVDKLDIHENPRRSAM
jgi:hypothetical protein